MLMIGTLYSWAMFAQPLVVGFGWDLTTTTGAYAIANFFLASVGVVVGGFWLDRKGPRPVAMTGVALWGAGNVLAGLGTVRLGAPWLYVTYGMIGGIGAGMAYITPLAVVSKSFPERRGLAGGLVVGCFGLGAFFYNQLIPRLPAFHTLSVHAANTLAANVAAQRLRRWLVTSWPRARLHIFSCRSSSPQVRIPRDRISRGNAPSKSAGGAGRCRAADCTAIVGLSAREHRPHAPVLPPMDATLCECDCRDYAHLERRRHTVGPYPLGGGQHRASVRRRDGLQRRRAILLGRDITASVANEPSPRCSRSKR